MIFLCKFKVDHIISIENRLIVSIMIVILPDMCRTLRGYHKINVSNGILIKIFFDFMLSFLQKKRNSLITTIIYSEIFEILPITWIIHIRFLVFCHDYQRLFFFVISFSFSLNISLPLIYVPTHCSSTMQQIGTFSRGIFF